MNSQLLEIAGLATGITAIIMSIIAIYFSGKARTWNKYFRAEEQPENLENIIDKVASKIKNLEDAQAFTESLLEKRGEQLDKATQHVGLVRFDSGADDGGNLSFTAAFLNAHQTGLVITSLHGRQHNRVYSKNIVKGRSDNTLSEEEKEAVIQALTNKIN
jgi:hypothetical protein